MDGRYAPPKKMDQYTVVNIDVVDNLTIAANNQQAGTVDVTYPEGYEPVGIVGWSFYNATTSGINLTWCALYRLFLNENGQIVYGARNYYSSAAVVKLWCKVLCKKTEE